MISIRTRNASQSGFGMIASMAALVTICAVFLILFLASGSGGGPKIGSTQNNQAQKQSEQTKNEQARQETPATKEPPYIRIPDNSLIYANKTYQFMFAYPDSFGKLTEAYGATSVAFLAESGIATQKPVGTSGAVLTGHLSAYVYRKDLFRIMVDQPNIYIAPAKTGNDTTWKVVSMDPTDKDIAVGDAYKVDTIKSQTSIPVFSLPLLDNNQLLGRLAFEAGDYYVLITLPHTSKPGSVQLSDADVRAYIVIMNNIAKTVRVQAVASSSTTGNNRPTNSTTNDSSSGFTGNGDNR